MIITDPNRAGRAPYNFVAPADEGFTVDPPRDSDRYYTDRISGEIEVTLTALTDFFIRGIQRLDRYCDGAKTQPATFSVAGRLRIPGSTIRGAIRTLVEILGKAPLDPIDDRRYAYRAVAASPSAYRDGRPVQAFEPFAKRYRDILWDTGKAGYLKRNVDKKYQITPASLDRGHGFYKVDWGEPNRFAQSAHFFGTAFCIGSPTGARKFLIGKKSSKYSKVDLSTSPDYARLAHLAAQMESVPCFFKPQPGGYQVLLEPADTKGLVGIYLTEKGQRCWFADPLTPKSPVRELAYFRSRVYFDPTALARIPRQSVTEVTSWGQTRQGSHTQLGWMVCSGAFQGKHYEWIINRPAENSFLVDDVAEDWHRNAGLMDWIESGDDADAKEQQRWLDTPSGLPCFFAQANETGRPRVYFGPTRYFRVPYAGTVHQANPRPRSGDAPDLAEAVFGRLSRKHGSNRINGWRGRVFVEDAFHIEGTPIFREECKVVLGTPKPTVFQHYVAQTDQRLALSTHWESRSQDGTVLIPRLRGNKIYWHQPNPPPLPDWDNISDDMKSPVRRVGPPQEGYLRFRGRIRFENLSGVELGALLTALQLPWEGSHKMAHKIGMGKPLGWGSFRLETRLFVMTPNTRYESFFNEPLTGTLCAGLSETRADDYLNEFAGWYAPGCDRASLWGCDNRMTDLAALLEFERQRHIPDWPERVRYLSLQPFNEYREITPERLSLRRPLPGAGQVLAARV